MPINALETMSRWTWPPWAILEGSEIAVDANDQMSQYLDDQGSIARYSHVA